MSGVSACRSLEKLSRIAPTQPKQSSGAKSQLIIAFEKRRQRINLADVDGRRFMDAHKPLIAELLEEVAKGATKQVSLN